MTYLDKARAALELMRQEPVGPPPAASGSEGPPSHQQVAGMTLEEFSQAGLVVRVNSEALGCRVLFVSDDVPESSLADARWPVYRAAELRRLAVLQPQPHTLRFLHEAKTIFQGAISDVIPNDDEG